MHDPSHADLAIIGLGAAGLMAAIHAGRQSREHHHRLHIVGLDGAARLGAKILVAGGGRCNVTHDRVTEHDYAGGSPNAIRNVLRRFDVPATIDFFRHIGVELKREDTGKLFPTTDSARTVLDALLAAARHAGVELRTSHRVQSVHLAQPEPSPQIDAPDPTPRFVIHGPWGTLTARSVILAAGGRALPKSGSDGHGYTIATALGHSLTKPITPALTPLVTTRDWPLRQLSGVALPVRLQLVAGSGKRLVSFHAPMLLTHFGVSGPAAMDISRHWLHQHQRDPQAAIYVNWLPDHQPEDIERQLQALGSQRIGRWLAQQLPDRLAHALIDIANLDPQTTGAQLPRQRRRALLDALTNMKLPITGDRGYTHAEATAGGVPLNEINIKTMASRCCPGLYLCGEICDVDGRIGGFNFQWAWASGYLAALNAVNALASTPPRHHPE